MSTCVNGPDRIAYMSVSLYKDMHFAIRSIMYKSAYANIDILSSENCYVIEVP